MIFGRALKAISSLGVRSPCFVGLLPLVHYFVNYTKWAQKSPSKVHVSKNGFFVKTKTRKCRVLRTRIYSLKVFSFFRTDNIFLA